VGFDDGAANRQPHPHAERFRGEERLKNAVYKARINATARIFHGDLHVTGFSNPGFHDQHALSSGDWTHSLYGIHDKVEKHLLKLRRRGQNSWKTVT